MLPTEMSGISLQKDGSSGCDLSPAVLLRTYLQSHEAVLVCDGENRIVSINPAFTEMTGYTLAEALGQKPKMLASGRTTSSTYLAMWQALEATGFWQGELWDRRKDSSIFPKWSRISVIRNAAGEVVNYIASFTDIGEHTEAADRLAHLAGLSSHSGNVSAMYHDVVRARPETRYSL